MLVSALDDSEVSIWGNMSNMLNYSAFTLFESELSDSFSDEREVYVFTRPSSSEFRYLIAALFVAIFSSAIRQL